LLLLLLLVWLTSMTTPFLLFLPPFVMSSPSPWPSWLTSVAMGAPPPLLQGAALSAAP
jgi:hypothetical protein